MTQHDRATGYVLHFVLEETIPTVNTYKRLHWGKVAKIRRGLYNLVWVATHGRRPSPPITRCAIYINRYSTQEPDPDCIDSSAKLLLDVLQPYHPKWCPNGLGIIAQDNSKCIADLKVTHVPARAKTRRTEVWIVELESGSV